MSENHRAQLAQYIEDRAESSDLSYDEIGVLCGFKNGNLIHAFANGEIRPPLDMISTLAEALRGDLGLMFTLALRDFFSPKLLQELSEVNLVHIDRSATSWIRALNEIFDGDIPEMNDRLRDRLELVKRTL